MKVSIGLSDASRKKTAVILSVLLANEAALALATRGAHWNVTGPQFASLHPFFGAQYEALNDVIDDVAERIRALGHTPASTLSAFASASTINDGAGSGKDATAMIESLLGAHEAVIRLIRKDAGEVGELGDEGTVDFLVGLIEAHEKTAWMLRAHLG
jgi:starvation-inducible DNA-binding protein